MPLLKGLKITFFICLLGLKLSYGQNEISQDSVVAYLEKLETISNFSKSIDTSKYRIKKLNSEISIFRKKASSYDSDFKFANRWGLIKDGEILYSDIFEVDLKEILVEGRYIKLGIGEFWGFFNYDKNIWKIYPQYLNLKGLYSEDSSRVLGIIATSYASMADSVFQLIDFENNNLLSQSFRSMQYSGISGCIIVSKLVSGMEKWAILSIRGELIHPFTEKMISPIGFSSCLKKGSFSNFKLIDVFGNELLKETFQAIESINISGTNYFSLKKDEKFALVDEKGKEIIPFGAKEIGDRVFKGVYIIIQNENKSYGVFDLKKKKFENIIFDEIDSFYLYLVNKNNKGLVPIRNGNYWSFLVVDSEPLRVSSLDMLDNKPLLVNDTFEFFIISKNGKKGLISVQGDLLLEPKYDDISSLTLSTVRVKDKNYEFMYDLKKSSFRDERFSLVGNTKIDNTAYYKGDWEVVVYSKDGINVGLFSLNSQIGTDPIFKSVLFLCQGVASVYDKNNKIRLYSLTKNEYVSEIFFDVLFPMNDYSVANRRVYYGKAQDKHYKVVFFANAECQISEVW